MWSSALRPFSPAASEPGASSRRTRGPRLGLHWCVGQALTTEAIAECIRSGGVWEAESNLECLDLVSTPAASDWDASVTVERINLWQNIAKAFPRKCEFDQVWEVPFVRKADKLALATNVTSHLAQSSSASRFTAGAFEFFILSQSGERPER